MNILGYEEEHYLAIQTIQILELYKKGDGPVQVTTDTSESRTKITGERDALNSGNKDGSKNWTEEASKAL
ncbi:hypothetical protein Tco_0794727 [Tanacetum coccineum]